jgi:hypothetical protein
LQDRQPFGPLSQESQMKGIALWLLGVPVILIVALYLFGIL